MALIHFEKSQRKQVSTFRIKLTCKFIYLAKHDLPQFLSSQLGDTDFLMTFGLEYVVCRFEEKNGLSKSYELTSI